MTDQTLSEGNTLRVDADVTNRGDVAASNASVTLTVDGTDEDSTTVDLPPDDTASVLLLWLTASGDAQSADYEVCVTAGDREDCIDVNVS